MDDCLTLFKDRKRRRSTTPDSCQHHPAMRLVLANMPATVAVYRGVSSSK